MKVAAAILLTLAALTWLSLLLLWTNYPWR